MDSWKSAIWAPTFTKSPPEAVKPGSDENAGVKWPHLLELSGSTPVGL